MRMEESRWPKIVLNWDLRQGCVGWLGDIRLIAHKIGIPEPMSNEFTYDLDFIEREMHIQARENRKSEAALKPKLRTYCKIVSFQGDATIAKANLTRFQRSLLSKFVCGIMPLEIETGRYWNLKVEERLCKLCKSNEVEDELHFFFLCDALEYVRAPLLKECLENINREHAETSYDILKGLLEPPTIERVGKLIETIFNERRNQLYRPNI